MIVLPQFYCAVIVSVNLVGRFSSPGYVPSLTPAPPKLYVEFAYTLYSHRLDTAGNSQTRDIEWPLDFHG